MRGFCGLSTNREKQVTSVNGGSKSGVCHPDKIRSQSDSTGDVRGGKNNQKIVDRGGGGSSKREGISD